MWFLDAARIRGVFRTDTRIRAYIERAGIDAPGLGRALAVNATSCEIRRSDIDPLPDELALNEPMQVAAPATGAIRRRRSDGDALRRGTAGGGNALLDFL